MYHILSSQTCIYTSICLAWSPHRSDEVQNHVSHNVWPSSCNAQQTVTRTLRPHLTNPYEQRAKTTIWATEQPDLRREGNPSKNRFNDASHKSLLKWRYEKNLIIEKEWSFKEADGAPGPRNGPANDIKTGRRWSEEDTYCRRTVDSGFGLNQFIPSLRPPCPTVSQSTTKAFRQVLFTAPSLHFGPRFLSRTHEHMVELSFRSQVTSCLRFLLIG